MQGNIGVLGGETRDHLRKRVSRLGMRRGDAETAMMRCIDFLGDALDILPFVKHADRVLEHVTAGVGEIDQVTPLADEHGEPKLTLEQLDLAADSGLRGVQGFGRRRDAQPLSHHLHQVFELTQFHISILY